MTGAVHCLWDVKATLGEGALWDAVRRKIWFVDIKGRRIHCCDEDGGARQSWDAPSQIGFLAPSDDGGMVCGLEDGLYRFVESDGAFIALARVEADLPGNRFNDGHVDAAGRLWFGSMDNGESEATGTLYRFDGAGQPARAMDAGYIITNGPAISPDGGHAVPHRHAGPHHLRVRPGPGRRAHRQAPVRHARRQRPSGRHGSGCRRLCLGGRLRRLAHRPLRPARTQDR